MAKKPLWRMLAVMSATVFALAIAASAFAQAPPSPPHQFFGSGGTGSGAELDGEAVADGATVTAWNQDGDEVGSAEVADGTWLIQVDPADATSVTFTVDGSVPSEPQEVTAGALTELGLSLASADDGGGDDVGDDVGDDGEAPTGLPATGTGGLAGSSSLPVLPLALAVSVMLALGGVSVARRTRA